MLWETRLPTAGMSQCCYHVTLWTDPRLQSDAKGHFSRYHRFFSGSLLFSASAVYLYLYNQTILIFRCFVQEARVAMHLCEVAVCVFARVGLCVNHWCRAAPPPSPATACNHTTSSPPRYVPHLLSVLTPNYCLSYFILLAILHICVSLVFFHFFLSFHTTPKLLPFMILPITDVVVWKGIGGFRRHHLASFLSFRCNQLL